LIFSQTFILQFSIQSCVKCWRHKCQLINLLCGAACYWLKLNWFFIISLFNYWWKIDTSDDYLIELCVYVCECVRLLFI
jgi:hypothetical protein